MSRRHRSRELSARRGAALSLMMIMAMGTWMFGAVTVLF